MTTNLKRTLMTAQEFFWIPWWAQFTLALLVSLIPRFSYPSSLQSLTPIPPLSQLVNFLFYWKKRSKSTNSEVSVTLCTAFSPAKTGWPHSKQWQPLHLVANLITSQEIHWCSSLPFLLYQQFPPPLPSQSHLQQVYIHLLKKKEKNFPDPHTLLQPSSYFLLSFTAKRLKKICLCFCLYFSSLIPLQLN